MEPHLWDFAELRLFRKDFTFDSEMRYILWVSALLGACDVIQEGCQYGHYLEFYPKLEIIQKGQKFKILMIDT